MRQRAAVVLLTLVVAYAAFYLCRSNVDSSLPLLKKAFGYENYQLGLLSSVPVAAYAVGKVVMGTLGDVIGGKRLMLLAIAGSVVATFAFSASSTLWAFVAFASVNRFFQSGGWSGAVGVVARRFEPARHGAVMGVMSTSYEMGNVGALLLCGLIVAVRPDWRLLFIINPLLLAAAGLFLAGMLADAAPPPKPSIEFASAPPVDEPPLGQIVLALARRPAFWVTVALSMLLTFLRVGFLTWTPLYLYEVSHLPDFSGAIKKAATFSAAGVVAALSMGVLSDRFGRGRRAPLIAGSMAVVVLLTLVLAHGGIRSPVVAAVLLGGVGFFLLGPYSLLAGALALDASGKRGAATAAGLIDGAGYAGGSLAGVTLGVLAQAGGWSSAFDATAIVAFLATVVSGAWAVAIFRRP